VKGGTRKMKRFIIIFLAVFVVIVGCQAVTDGKNVNNVTTQNVSEASKYYDFAKEYLKNKMFDSAIRNYRSAIVESTAFIDAYIGLGKSFEGKFDYTRAESVYNYMIDAFPKNAEGFNSYGFMYLTIKEYTNAEKQFTNALKVDSMNSKAYDGLGQVYEKQKPSNSKLSALTCYEKACTYDPENIAVSYRFAKALIKSDKYEKAVDLLKKVSDDHPTFIEPITNLADAYVEIKEYKNAINAYNKVLDLDSTYFNAFLGIARSYEALNDYSNAETYYKKLMNVKPNSTIPHLYLAQMYLTLKNYDKTIDILNTALSKNQNDENALIMIAQAYFFKVDPQKVKDANRDEAYGYLDKSEEYFNKIINMNGKYSSDAKKGLENVKKRRKEIDPNRWQ